MYKCKLLSLKSDRANETLEETKENTNTDWNVLETLCS